MPTNENALLDLIESTRKQAVLEAERVEIEKARLTAEQNRVQHEADRVRILSEIIAKLDVLLDITQNLIAPTMDKTTQQNAAVIEVMRIMVSIYSNISKDDALQMEKILDKIVNKITVASPNITVGTTLKANNDMNITSGKDMGIS
jgi:hypothetical protein